MMNPVQGGMPPMGARPPGAATLSESQKESLSEVLSNYDVENLTDDDAKSLVSEISELDIPAGRGLTEALGAAGVDAGALAQQAGLQGPGGGRGPGGPGGPGGAGGPGGPGGAGGERGAKGPDSAAAQTMREVVEQLQAQTEDSDEDVDFASMLLSALEEAGLDTSKPIIDYRV